MLLAQTADNWLYWSNGAWIAFFCVALPIGGGIICGIVSIIAKNWRKARIAEAEARLKESLIAQGRPTAEIERIINASAYSCNKQADDDGDE
jgi:hypothetical protein